jgi:hypothetical protein
MRRLILVASIISAVFASSAIVPALAAAELPEFTVATAFTGTTGKYTLEGVSKTAITCSKGKSSGEVKGHEGTASFTLEECKEAKTACRSENAKGEKAPVETILMSGTLDLVVATGSPVEGGTLLLVGETKITCGVVKAAVKGTVISGISPLAEKTSKFTLTLNQKEGKLEQSKYYNEAGEAVEAAEPLSVNFGKGAEQAGIQAAEAGVSVAKATELKPPLHEVVTLSPIVYEKLANETRFMTYINVGTVTATLVNQALEGGEAGSWQITDENGCLNKALVRTNGCAVSIKLLNAAANSAFYKGKFLWADNAMGSFLPTLVNP